MPGLFSWKARFLGRKTPEAERAVHVTLNNQAGTAVASEEEKKKDDKKQQQQQQAQPRTVRFEPEKVGSGKIRTKSPAGRTTTTIHSHNEQSAMGITVGEWQNEYGEARLIANIPDHPQPIQPQPIAASEHIRILRGGSGRGPLNWLYFGFCRTSFSSLYLNGGSSL